MMTGGSPISGNLHVVETLREYHEIIMGIFWEYNPEIVGMLWEYDGNISINIGMNGI